MGLSRAFKRIAALGFVPLIVLFLAVAVTPARAATTTTLDASPNPCPMGATLTISGTISPAAPDVPVIVAIQGAGFVERPNTDSSGHWVTSIGWTWPQGSYTITAKPDVPDGVQASIPQFEGGVTIVKAVKTVVVNTAVTTDSLYMTVRTIVTTVTGSASTLTVSGTFTRTMSSGTVTVSTVVQSTAIATEVSTTLSTSTSTSTASATVMTTPHTTLTRVSTSTILTTTRVAPPTPLATYGVAIIAVVAVVLLHVWFLVLRKRRSPR